jgi:hypothetical protein
MPFQRSYVPLSNVSGSKPLLASRSTVSVCWYRAMTYSWKSTGKADRLLSHRTGAGWKFQLRVKLVPSSLGTMQNQQSTGQPRLAKVIRYSPG